MRIEDCRIGMPVVFGRDNGEQTKGVIVKLNLKSAKVKITEDRGRTKAGEVWGVGYGLLTPLDPKDQEAVKAAAQAIPVPAEKVLKYNPFSQDNLILTALLGVYCALEPEALTSDGEASFAQVRQRRAELQRKVKGLQYALGYEATESQVFNWGREKDESDRARQRQPLSAAFDREVAANAERTAQVCGLPTGIQ